MRTVTTGAPQFAFELTDAELALAHRYFRAVRSMDCEYREAVLASVDLAESIQKKYPLYAKPMLHLVGGVK